MLENLKKGIEVNVNQISSLVIWKKPFQIGTSRIVQVSELSETIGDKVYVECRDNSVTEIMAPPDTFKDWEYVDVFARQRRQLDPCQVLRLFPPCMVALLPHRTRSQRDEATTAKLLRQMFAFNENIKNPLSDFDFYLKFFPDSVYFLSRRFPFYRMR